MAGIISCNKSIDTIPSERVENYAPMELGKHLIYQLDSTVFTNLGATKEIHSYIIKDTILFFHSDSQGKKTYHVLRLLRNRSDTNTWNYLENYWTIADSSTFEWIESNKRFIKLKAPIKNGFTWKGNSYFNTSNYPDAAFLHDWKYTYEKVNTPLTLNSINIPSSISILQKNDTLGDPSNKSVYSEINYSREVYGKGIGLIYKELLYQVWQPGNANNQSGYFEQGSYGIKISILKHNFYTR